MHFDGQGILGSYHHSAVMPPPPHPHSAPPNNGPYMPRMPTADDYPLNSGAASQQLLEAAEVLAREGSVEAAQSLVAVARAHQQSVSPPLSVHLSTPTDGLFQRQSHHPQQHIPEMVVSVGRSPECFSREFLENIREKLRRLGKMDTICPPIVQGAEVPKVSDKALSLFSFSFLSLILLLLSLLLLSPLLLSLLLFSSLLFFLPLSPLLFSLPSLLPPFRLPLLLISNFFLLFFVLLVH